MKVLFLTVALLACAVFFYGHRLAGEDKKDITPSQAEKSANWMKTKLALSQNILAGLTESDFDKIRKNSEVMIFLGYLESWDRADRPDYKRQVTYFDLANRQLLRAAKEKNIDGATLAYNQLTVSCVGCHKLIRDGIAK